MYDAFDQNTSNNTSFNYGLLAGYRLKNRVFIRTGIKNINLNQTFIKDSIQIKNQVKYLEFPLEIKYVTKEAKLSPYLSGGISYFMLQDAKTNNENNSDYGSTFSLNAGIGLEYELSENILFNLEPNFTYQLQPFKRNDDISPFIFSVNFGIIYRF